MTEEKEIWDIVNSIQGKQAVILVKSKHDRSFQIKQDLEKLPAVDRCLVVFGTYDLVISIVLGVAANAIYDLIKYLYENRNKIISSIEILWERD